MKINIQDWFYQSVFPLDLKNYREIEFEGSFQVVISPKFSDGEFEKIKAFRNIHTVILPTRFENSSLPVSNNCHFIIFTDNSDRLILNNEEWNNIVRELGTTVDQLERDLIDYYYYDKILLGIDKLADMFPENAPDNVPFRVLKDVNTPEELMEFLPPHVVKNIQLHKFYPGESMTTAYFNYSFGYSKRYVDIFYDIESKRFYVGRSYKYDSDIHREKPSPRVELLIN